MKQAALFLTPVAALLVASSAAANQDGAQQWQKLLQEQLEPLLATAAGGLAQSENVLANLATLPGELGALTQELGAFSVREMGASRVVKGAPYCADAVNESVQTLADGNRIVRKTGTRWCRDGEGRTRQETDHGARKVVYLRDPVTKQSWTLDPQNKSAAKVGLSGMGLPELGVDSGAWREYGERMREWAKGFAQRMRSGASEKPGVEKSNIDPVVITQEQATGDGTQRKDVYVIRMNSEGGPVAAPPAPPVPPMPPAPPMPPTAGGAWSMPAPPMNVRMFAPRGQGVQTSLGSKEMEGVRANGEKTTWTIEAGKFGNEKPIVIVSEKWTSPDLMLTLYARDFDPRSGETVYKLNNLKRGEPDAELFKVPADYKVREGRSFGWPMPELRGEKPAGE
jgi:hypothetical protein